MKLLVFTAVLFGVCVGGLSCLGFMATLLVALPLVAAVSVCGWSPRLLYAATFFGTSFFVVWRKIGSFLDDPGVGWHLATGRFIASLGQVPRYDPFLFSLTPRVWVSDQWLSDLLSHLLLDWGGWSLLCTAGFLVFLATYLLSIPALLNRLGFSGVIGVVVTVVAVMIGLPHCLLRPVLLGNLLFALVSLGVFTLYHLHWQGTDTKVLNRYLLRLALVMPVLFLLWANLHPSFGMGIILWGILVVSLCIERWVLQRNVETALIIKIALIAGACALATVINPYGVALHRSISELVRTPFFMNFNDEWQPMRHRLLEGQLFEVIFIVVGMALVLRPDRILSRGCFPIFVVLFFAHGALQHARMISYFGIVMTPLFALALSTVWESLCERFSMPLRALLPHDKVVGDSAALFSSVAVTLLVTCVSSGPLHETVWGQVGFAHIPYPFAALDAIKRDNPSAVVYANPDLGGFITYQGNGDIKAVLDDRNGVLPEDMYQEYALVNRGDAQTADILRHSGATHLLIRRGEPTEALFSYRPDLVMYRDAEATVVQVDRLSELPAGMM